jgi:hypothetical protein
MVRTGGLEPPPPGFVVRHIVPLCYVRMVRRAGLDERRINWLPSLVSNQASPVNNRLPSPRWLDGKKLVETVGNAPTATILQGSSAPLCCPRMWCLELVSSQPLRVFSAALSPDQLPRRIGLPAEAPKARRLVRTAGVEPTPPEWRSGTLPLSHVRHSASSRAFDARLRRAMDARKRAGGASPRIRTSRRPTCLFHRRRFYGPVAGKGRVYVSSAFAEASADSLRARGWLASRSATRRLEEGEGVEPSTVRSARFSRPVACHHAPPSDQESVISNQWSEEPRSRLMTDYR